MLQQVNLPNIEIESQRDQPPIKFEDAQYIRSLAFENELVELVMLLKTSKINRSVQNIIVRADNNSVAGEKKKLQIFFL